MKTLLRLAVSILLTYGLLNLTACNSSNTTNSETAAVNDDYEDERIEISEDLRELREDVSDQIQKVSQQMEDATADTKEEFSQLRDELVQKREEVDVELERIETASQENWNEVREGARNTFQDVKRDFNALRDRVSG